MNRAWAKRRAALFELDEPGAERAAREAAPIADPPAAGGAADDQSPEPDGRAAVRKSRRRRRTTPTRHAEPRDFTRRDYARSRRRGGSSVPWAQIGVGLLIAAMLLVSLRLAILRTRYELAEALETETRLLERERASTVELRKLRDPQRLQELALERGFTRPERVVELAPVAAPPPAGPDARP